MAIEQACITETMWWIIGLVGFSAMEFIVIILLIILMLRRKRENEFQS